MNQEIIIRINDKAGTKKHTDYVGWGPRPAWISQTRLSSSLSVTLRNNGLPGGGKVTFFRSVNGRPDMLSPTNELSNITLPASSNPENNWVQFFVAGEFNQTTGKGAVSSIDKDTGIGVYQSSTNELLYTKRLMVRVRKNANRLSAVEKRDFLEAIMILNTNQGVDFPWKNLQDMHVPTSSREIHGRSSFLPWHRAYLLNLERDIQSLEVPQSNGTVKSYAHVTIPYWDFFSTAQNMFNRDFLGFPDSAGVVQFNASNPLVNWQTNLSGTDVVILGPKLRRSHKLQNSNSFAWDPSNTGSPIFTLGGEWSWASRTENGTVHDFSDYRRFAHGVTTSNLPGLETTPHGAAHVSWGGPIMRVGWSPADPLFFMLHSNIDRLWTLWQWLTPGYRFNPSDRNSYDRQGVGGTGTVPTSSTKGNYTEDTMWPWDGDDQPPRPAQANWGGLPDSPTVTAPGAIPKVKQMIDYHAQYSQNPADNLGFDYEDIPLDYPQRN